MKKRSESSLRSKVWPVLKTYSGRHLRRIALPLGGIGTGTVSLGGRGDLRDWEVMNQPAKGFNPGTFFAIWLQRADGSTGARLLEGPLDQEDYEGASGCSLPNHNMPRFRKAEFSTAYPLAQVLLSDPEMPVQVRMEAFNPLIPGDAESSGMPVAVIRFVVKNMTNKPLNGSLCGTLPNFVGAGPSLANFLGTESTPTDPFKAINANLNRYRVDGKLKGIFMSSERPDHDQPGWGTMALTTDAAGAVSYRTDWAKLSWGNSLLDFWDDFTADGRLENPGSPEPQAEGYAPKASLAVPFRVAPRGECVIPFFVTWHFPNRMTWTPRKPEEGAAPAGGACDCGGQCGNPDTIGNYYTTRFKDAWDVACQVARQLPRLEAGTVRFVETFLATDLPEVVKEAALFNVSTLRSQTTFRLPSGHLLGWEGCGDKGGCCHGSCTHVWNYEQATPFLFGDLARTMREVEFRYSTNDAGMVSFRTNLPLTRAQDWKMAAADGQMGCLMKLYREWKLSGDDEFLKALWPKARKALEFCWVPGGWDADRDGVMEGCQHNTMDVEYYGPNPQMTGWYLGALRSCEEMARYLGEKEFADQCRDLFERGKAWMDEHLFNGHYYEHEIRPILSDSIAGGLRIGMGSKDLSEPALQLGSGCLIDQLVGQFVAHVCGLGYLHDPAKVRTTLQSILKYNFKSSFHGHFNHLRSFVLGDEQAVVMATYPLGRRPQQPFPYYNEVMTGFEYALAVGLIYEGEKAAGLKCIRAIRDRYDGLRRSPFDEAECGHHYARAMASWGAVLAIPGFYYSGVEQTMTFAARPGRWFWSNGTAWGDCVIVSRKQAYEVTLRVQGGDLALKTLILQGRGEARMKGRIRAGKTVTVRVG